MQPSLKHEKIPSSLTSCPIVVILDWPEVFMLYLDSAGSYKTGTFLISTVAKSSLSHYNTLTIYIICIHCLMWSYRPLAPLHLCMKSCAKAKEDVDPNALKPKCAPDIQWVKNPDWIYNLIAYLGDHPMFCLQLFSHSTTDASKAGWPKLTANGYIFAKEPRQSMLYLQNSGRYGTAVKTGLWWYDLYYPCIYTN